MLIPAHLSTLKLCFSLLVMTVITSIILVGCGNSQKSGKAGADTKKEEKLGRWDPAIQGDYEKVDPALAKEKGCRSCHSGIDVINDTMQPHLLAVVKGKKGYECTVCHEGKADAATKAEAHAGFWPNPSSMWVASVGKGCGKCHSGKGKLTTVMTKKIADGPKGGGVLQVESKLSDPSGLTGTNHIYRMARGLMALETGKATKTMSSNGVIEKGTFPYSNFDMDDPDGPAPTVGSAAYKEWMAKAEKAGLVKRVDEVAACPPFEEGKKIFGDPVKAAYADMHLKQCARCHVWGEGRGKRGDHRAGGCAACHILYTNDGLYEGDDKTIPKDRGPHSMRHRITRKIPAQQCTHCHTRGKRIGTTFVGMIEHQYVGSGKTPPWDDKGKPQRRLFTKEYNHVRADVHSERGMDCADCHSSIDVHGDGNIYPVTFYQVEIGCADCHGTADKYPWELSVGYGTPIQLKGPRGVFKSEGKEYLISTRGNPRKRWYRKGTKAYLKSIYSGKEYEIPMLKEKSTTKKWKSKQGKVAMADIPQHMESLECYACHSSWAPQCYGCHIQYDMRKTGTNWAQSAVNHDPSTGKQIITKESGDIGMENVGYVRWARPILGKNYKGRVSPLVPGCQTIWTFIDKDGKVITSNQLAKTSDGQNAPTLAPLQPHANMGVARTCESCHTDPKALGYGEAKSRTAGQLEGDKPQFANQGPGVFGDIPASQRATPQIPAVKKFPYAWDQLVTRSGKQVQNMPLVEDKPLSKKQRRLAEREGLCMSCHQHYSKPAWEAVRKKMRKQLNIEGRALTTEEHDKAVEILLLSFADEKKK